MKCMGIRKENVYFMLAIKKARCSTAKIFLNVLLKRRNAKKPMMSERMDIQHSSVPLSRLSVCPTPPVFNFSLGYHMLKTPTLRGFWGEDQPTTQVTI